jgi:hypothetical protein
MVTARYSIELLMLICEINCLVAKEKTLPTWLDLTREMEYAGMITDSGLVDWSNDILDKHLRMAVTGPITNTITKAFVPAVSGVLGLHKNGVELFGESRYLLRSYLILNYAGVLARN